MEWSQHSSLSLSLLLCICHHWCWCCVCSVMWWSTQEGGSGMVVVVGHVVNYPACITST